MGKGQQKMWSELSCHSKTLALVAISSSIQQCQAVKKVHLYLDKHIHDAYYLADICHCF